MALSIKSTLVAINTSGGTQDITISGFGTVKAAMFVWTRAASGDDHASNSAISIGFFDGTRSRAFCSSSEDAVGNTAADRAQSDTSCGLLLNPGASTIDGEFSGNSFISDGVRINLDDFAGAEYLCQVTLFGGSDIANIYCNHHDDLGNGTSAVPITDPGFQADLVFIVTIGASAVMTDPPTIDAHQFLDFGVWSVDDATERFIGIGDRHNEPTSEVATYSDSNDAIGQITWSTVQWTANITTNANGFDVTPDLDSGTDIIGYLCIEWAVVPEIEIVGSSMPASGDWVEAGFSFQPDFGMTAFVSAPTHDVFHDTNFIPMSFSIGVIESSQVLTSGIASLKEATTSETACWAKSTFFIGDSDGTTVQDEGTLQSIDANGWTIDLGGGTNDGVLRKGWSLAIKAAGAASVTKLSLDTGYAHFGDIVFAAGFGETSGNFKEHVTDTLIGVLEAGAARGVDSTYGGTLNCGLDVADGVNFGDNATWDGLSACTMFVLAKNNKTLISDTNLEVTISKWGGGADSYRSVWTDQELWATAVGIGGSNFTDSIVDGLHPDETHADEWNLVGFTWDGSDIIARVNSIKGPSGTASGTMQATAHDVFVGNQESGGNGSWDGEIAMAVIMDVALNDTDWNIIAADPLIMFSEDVAGEIIIVPTGPLR